MSDEDFEGLGDDLDGLVPDSLADDTYLCEIAESKPVTSKKDGKRYHSLKWLVIQEGLYYGEEINEMYRVSDRAEFEKVDGDDQRRIKDARRKRLARLTDLGFKRDELSNIKAKDLEGIKAYLTVRVRPRKDGQGFNIWIDNCELATSVKDTIADF